MEARSRRVGGGFPGYNGPALPRAMRSSRGRGQSARRVPGYDGHSGFFELLATVAGQILQEDAEGEEQEMLNLPERGTRKLKCSDPIGTHPKDSELPVCLAIVEKLQLKPSSAFASCLDSPGEAIRDYEVGKLLCEGTKNEGIGADSVHSVINKSFLSCPPADEHPQTLVETVKPLNPERYCDISITPLQKVYQVDKQMSSPVSENNENQPVKCDPDSSISATVKHPVELDKIFEETMEGVLTPKAEEVVNGKVFSDEKANLSGIRGNEQTSDMEIDLPKVSIFNHGLVCENWTPFSSTVTETKADRSSGEVAHFCCDLKEDVTVITDFVGKKISDGRVSCEGDVKPWKRTGSCTNEGDGESDPEVDHKNSLDSKKSLKVTDVILGKLEPKEAECGFLSELILENTTERISFKDGHCGSAKLLPDKGKKLNESYTRGMGVRKVVKMVKRSPVLSSQSKRKHDEVEVAVDSEGGPMKKSYYGGLSYTRQRTSRGYPAKRKKMTNGSPKGSPNLHVNTSDLMGLGFECVEGEPPAAAAKLRSAKAASVASSPTAKGSTKILKKPGEPHVKLTIKSFKVPELSVDLPESATISSLKRAVMDAAMNLLGGGLRVRVLLQGKKVPDEGATLAQVGISRAAKPDLLGFMLEPSPMPTSPTTSEDPLLVLSRAAGHCSPRYPVFGTPGVASAGDPDSRCPNTHSDKVAGGSVDGEVYGTPRPGDQIEAKQVGLSFPVPQEDALKGCPGSKPRGGVHDRLALSHSTRVAAAGALAAMKAQTDANRRASKNELETTDPVSHSVAHESLVQSSGAIILHPGMTGKDDEKGLALVPLRQKSHSMEAGKRRVRRPFSVAEVEALVYAVEKLGTGRWRDVKLRAFDQAKHRTYVDLKDKWKTLVHTARIAPHQRRGEPVPQELLERVTRAHTYWSAQAAKHQAEIDY